MNTPARVDNTGLAVLTTVRNYGVDTIFGIPGTHNVELYRHLAPLGIHPVTTRHEQGAGYAADAWGQVRGLPGVVLTTSGPGLLNVLSAAGTSFCESRPLLVISPGPALGDEFADRGTLHETKNSTGAADAIFAWSRRAETPAAAVEAIHDAFALFATGRPRSVHLEIPLDVLAQPHGLDAATFAPRVPATTPLPAADAIAEAARVLAAAKRPVILAGGGSTRAAAQVARLAGALQAPVVTTLNGKGVLPETHHLALGANLRLATVRDECNAADALLVIGSKLGEAELWGGHIAPAAASVVRIDLEATQITKHLTPDLGLVGDSAAILDALLSALDADAARPAPSATRAGSVAEVRASALAEAAAIAPSLARIARDLADVLPRETIVAGDSSQITYFGTATFVPQDAPRSYLYMATYATLGYGLPAALGAKVAAPERPVVCVLGDGALMFSIQELATAAEQGLSFVVVCVENGGYAEIRENQIDLGVEPVGVNLFQPDWAALATAFGGHGEKLTRADDLGALVTAGLARPGVTLIHVPLAVFEA
ncbi:thiamine pyrophosphate-binding protein [Micrococcales bacterium 31B]|nr:thiamine pyrophosphate-binding protein [Micrococcales bacterium 31B]